MTHQDQWTEDLAHSGASASIPTEPVTLLPCPFCGGPQHHRFNSPDEFGRPSHGVQCANGDCWIVGPQCETEADATAAWNRRAGQGAVADLAVCREALGVMKTALEEIARANPENTQSATASEMSEWTHCAAVIALVKAFAADSVVRQQAALADREQPGIDRQVDEPSPSRSESLSGEAGWRTVHEDALDAWIEALNNGKVSGVRDDLLTLRRAAPSSQGGEGGA